MKYLTILIFLAYTVYAVPPQLLGAKQCTWGPSYWCSNLTAASGCHAVKHCIQTVWQHKQVPEDTDSVCQTCLKMVKEARDQLLSNETEEEIKEVFEGSCKLIPVKVINRECCTLVDQFVPELVDTLASQMNPQVVCSVAGLCNNARYDGLIADYEKDKRNSKLTDQCDGCHTVVDILHRRFEKMSKDDVLQSFLRVCGRLGSLADACSNIVVTYFKDIYQHLEANLNSNDVCLLTGECSAKFHTHVEITPLSNVGVVKVRTKDDLPCELCQQLVSHLRDLLIANTTEDEFERVLQGLCKQTGQFSSECQSLVSEYYPMIYKTLVNELNGTVACAMIDICPAPTTDLEDVPIRPLLPIDTVDKASQLMEENQGEKLHRVNLEKSGSNVQILQKPEMMQLPIERIFPSFGAPEVYNQQACLFCEYLLHYLQEAITEPATETEIKQECNKLCSKLPSPMNETCVSFVDVYGDAVVSLLVQEFDPSVICPLIRVCPAPEAKDVETFKEIKGGDQPKCPMCLFAVTKLEDLIKDDKTEKNIEAALDKLCSHLKGNMKAECEDFVNTYSKTLISFLISEVKPQEICVKLKLCSKSGPQKPLIVVTEADDMEVLTNEIPDFTRNGKVVSKPEKLHNKPQCIMCEFAMSKLESLLENKTTEAEIKNAVLGLCNDLPKSVRSECTSFVNKYADIVIQLLVGTLHPDEICQYIGLCDKSSGSKPVDIEETTVIPTPVGSPQCMICKLVMGQLERLIIGPMSKDAIETALHQVCDMLPKSEEDSCNTFVNQYGDTIISLLIQAAQPAEICSLMFFCAEHNKEMIAEIKTCSTCEALYINIVNGMLSGMEKVEDACKPVIQENKRECLEMATQHSVALVRSAFHQRDVTSVCQELKKCKGQNAFARIRRQTQAVGASKCTWGPGYWCKSPQNADECSAHKYCSEKVWVSGAAPSRKRRQVMSLGARKCTWGPSYWCANQQNADECTAHKFCSEKVWVGGAAPSRKRRQATAVGAGKCTWGPSYWCASEQSANECGPGAYKHCSERVWVGGTPPPAH